MSLIQEVKNHNPFFLAPMAGVTVPPFRAFMREMGCGVITSELVSARALKDKNQKTLQLMEFSASQKPYGIQLFGEDPLIIAEGAQQAEDFGADFIDLNLGCPVNKIIKKGAGSALLKDLKKLSKILHSLKSSVKIPVTLKVRTGWDSQSLNADQVARIAFEEGFSWMSIHGRTRSQAYSGKADWNYIKEVKSRSSIPIVGNGDLISGAMAFSALCFSGCDGVMIGRGCLNDPWIFLSALELLKKNRSMAEGVGSPREKTMDGEEKSTWIGPNKNNITLDFISPKGKNFKLVMDRLKNHLEEFYDERLFLLQIKKFSAWFSAGFPHSTEFRKSLFQEKDKQIALQKIDEFFTEVQDEQKPPPVYEPFLMKGHG